MKQFLFLAVMLSSTAFAQTVIPCGTQGSVAERIKSCNTAVGKGGEFQLVTRTAKGEEIYKGARTGVIWSADLAKPMYYLSDKVETICKTNRSEFGGLQGLKWILPEAGRYIQALRFDIQSSLPNMKNRQYWTSTEDSFYVTSRYIFEGSKKYVNDGSGNYVFRHLETDIGLAHVKCIVETI